MAEAESSPAPFVRLADRYALWFLVLTLTVAGAAWAVAGASRAVAVLVVATPCPLILGAPVALVSGLSLAARRGVVVKGGGVLEQLARCRTLLFDKTGTLTSGHPALADHGRLGITAHRRGPRHGRVLGPGVAARARHAPSSRRPVNEDASLVLPEDVEEVAGRGIRGTVGGRPVAARQGRVGGRHRERRGGPGEARRMAQLDGALTVFVAVDDRPAGVLVLDDPLRPDAARTIRALRRGGIERVVMVTGDRAEVADTVGAVIGVDEVLAERSPAEKLDVVRRGAPAGAHHHGRRRDQRRSRPGPGRRRGGHGSPGRHRVLGGGRRRAHGRPTRSGGRGPDSGPPHPAHRPAERDRRDGACPSWPWPRPRPVSCRPSGARSSRSASTSPSS